MSMFGWTRSKRTASADTSIEGSEASEDPRIELLQASYKEVLDATKHQDDKVGRLLTATAFLTAAALALANLVGGRALPRPFEVDRQRLPALALLSLGTFLICIVFVVVMLLFSIATPLRIPAFAETPGAKSEEPRGPSQIYFYAIAGLSKQDWFKMWDPQNTKKLQKQLPSMYRDEVMNIAVRADFKYNRTNEGVAVLTFALLAFASAVVFVFSASVSPCQEVSAGAASCLTPVEFSAAYRVVLGSIVALWVLAALLTQLRYGRLHVDDQVGMLRPDRQLGRWLTAWAGRLFAICVSCTSGLLIIAPSLTFKSFPSAQLILFLLTVAAVSLLITHIQRPVPTGTRWSAHSYLFCLGSAILLTGILAGVAEERGQYLYGLAGGYALPIGIAVSALVGPTAVMAERRSRNRTLHSPSET